VGPPSGPPSPFFLQVLILKSFKSRVGSVHSREFAGMFLEVRIPKELVSGDALLVEFYGATKRVFRLRIIRFLAINLLESTVVKHSGRLKQTPGLRPTPSCQKQIRLLPISEAAAAMGCSYRTVMRGIKAGRIAATRRSRRAFVSEREVAKYAKPAYRPSRQTSQVKTARWYQSQGGSDQKVKRPPIVGAALLLEI